MIEIPGGRPAFYDTQPAAGTATTGSILTTYRLAYDGDFRFSANGWLSMRRWIVAAGGGSPP